jgi:hypothetical protein
MTDTFTDKGIARAATLLSGEPYTKNVTKWVKIK